MNFFAKLWIYLNCILYIGLGFFTLCKPNSVASTVGFQLITPGAIAELKASYGGMMIMLGLIMWMLYAKDSIAKSIGFIALVYIGFGTGRLVGICVNSAFDATTLSFSAFEIASVILSICLYKIYV